MNKKSSKLGLEKKMAKKQKEKKRTSPAEKVINAVLVIIVVAVLVLAGFAVGPKVSEKIKAMLPQPDTSVVSGMAESLGLSVDEFKAEYGLPENATGETAMADVVTELTLANYAKVSGTDYETLVADMGIAEKVTEDMTFGEAEALIPFGIYVGGEESFNQLKEAYALDDSITMDTPWGEVRPVIEQMEAQMQEAQQLAAEAEAQENAETDAAAE